MSGPGDTVTVTPTARANLSAALDVARVYKSFGGLQAVRDVSFKVHSNEIVGLIGPNGSGKTTVLNLIAGYYRPDAGRIICLGRDTVGLSAHQVARLGLLRAWQDPRVAATLTVRENIALGALAQGHGLPIGRRDLTTGIRSGLVKSLLDQFRLVDVADEVAGTLAYGRQKIVALARTFAATPRILVLDEPLAGLSRADFDFVISIIKGFRSEGAVLIVDHAFGAISKLCDRVVVLNTGMKLIEGTPSVVASNGEVREVYFGHR